MADILSFTGSQNLDDAWARYQRLALAEADQPRLAADIQHCKAKACAWAKWRDLYLASGAQA